MAVFIYGLYCPVKKTIRYIGKTINPEKRLASHIKNAKTNRLNHHCARWISSILRDGFEPAIQVLYILKDGEDWQECESKFIKQYRDWGYPLTNSTSGGDGFHDLPSELIRKRVANRKITMSDPLKKAEWISSQKAAHNNPEFKAKKSREVRAMWNDPVKRESYIQSMNTTEGRANRSNATKRRFENDEELQRHSATMKTVFSTAEAKLSQSLRSKRAWSDPERKAKRIGAIKSAYENPELRDRMSFINAEIASRPEVKAARSKASKSMWQNSREKLMAGYSKPEVKKAQSEKRKAAWADPEKGKRLREIHSSPETRKKKSDAAKARATPEYRALAAERTRLSWEKRRAKEPLATQ